MSLNKAMLIGNVGGDPEVRYIENGTCTARLRLATSTPGYTLPNGTNVPERTEWHTLQLWGRLAQVAEKYIHKGDKLYVEGQLRTRNYTDRQGGQHHVTEIWVNSLEMLTPRSQSQTNNGNAPAGNGATAAPQSATPTQTAAPKPDTNAADAFFNPNNGDSKLPF